MKQKEIYEYLKQSLSKSTLPEDNILWGSVKQTEDELAVDNFESYLEKQLQLTDTNQTVEAQAKASERLLEELDILTRRGIELSNAKKVSVIHSLINKERYGLIKTLFQNTDWLKLDTSALMGYSYDSSPKWNLAYIRTWLEAGGDPDKTLVTSVQRYDKQTLSITDWAIHTKNVKLALLISEHGFTTKITEDVLNSFFNEVAYKSTVDSELYGKWGELLKHTTASYSASPSIFCRALNLGNVEVLQELDKKGVPWEHCFSNTTSYTWPEPGDAVREWLFSKLLSKPEVWSESNELVWEFIGKNAAMIDKAYALYQTFDIKHKSIALNHWITGARMRHLEFTEWDKLPGFWKKGDKNFKQSKLLIEKLNSETPTLAQWKVYRAMSHEKEERAWLRLAKSPHDSAAGDTWNNKLSIAARAFLENRHDILSLECPELYTETKARKTSDLYKNIANQILENTPKYDNWYKSVSHFEEPDRSNLLCDILLSISSPDRYRYDRKTNLLKMNSFLTGIETEYGKDWTDNLGKRNQERLLGSVLLEIPGRAGKLYNKGVLPDPQLLNQRMRYAVSIGDAEATAALLTHMVPNPMPKHIAYDLEQQLARHDGKITHNQIEAISEILKALPPEILKDVWIKHGEAISKEIHFSKDQGEFVLKLGLEFPVPTLTVLMAHAPSKVADWLDNGLLNTKEVLITQYTPSKADDDNLRLLRTLLAKGEDAFKDYGNKSFIERLPEDLAKQVIERCVQFEEEKYRLREKLAVTTPPVMGTELELD